MIQRIQTLYLTIVIILGAVVPFFFESEFGCSWQQSVWGRSDMDLVRFYRECRTGAHNHIVV